MADPKDNAYLGNAVSANKLFQASPPALRVVELPYQATPDSVARYFQTSGGSLKAALGPQLRVIEN